MDFASADHGVDIVQMNAYIDGLNGYILTNVASAIRNTTDVETEVRAGWHGNAPEQFITNLNKAKEVLITTLSDLRTAFETELNGVKSAILDMDANLVDEE